MQQQSVIAATIILETLAIVSNMIDFFTLLFADIFF